MTTSTPTSARFAPLITRLTPVRQPALRLGWQLAAGVALLALLAQLRIEIGPVPITGQTFGVLLLGAAYGALRGGATLGLYLALGGAGLPIFQGGTSGLSGATAGYLIGFWMAAVLVGYLAQRGWDRRVASCALAMLLGNALIYLPGLLWLRSFAPDWSTTLQWGLWPFIPGDLVKLVLAALLLPGAWRLLGRRS